MNVLEDTNVNTNFWVPSEILCYKEINRIYNRTKISNLSKEMKKKIFPKVQ